VTANKVISKYGNTGKSITVDTMQFGKQVFQDMSSSVKSF